jgi:sugar lactone lactonase YvrE
MNRPVAFPRLPAFAASTSAFNRALSTPFRILVLLALAGQCATGRAQTAYVGQPLGGGFNAPEGIAVDSSGNVYVADTYNNAVKKIPAGCTAALYSSSDCTVTTLGGGFEEPAGVAVDSNGNVYVTSLLNLVEEMPPGCASASCVTKLGGGFSNPLGLTVDRSGNVYVADSNNSAIKEMPTGCASSTCVTTLGGGFALPYGVAVDSEGNVYVADLNNNAVKEMPPGCTAALYSSSGCTITTLGGGFNAPEDVAVDSWGNVYVADGTNLKEMPPGCASSSCVTAIGGGFGILGPFSVAAGGSGNVYVAVNSESAPVLEVVRQAFDFGSVAVNTATPASTTVTFTFTSDGTIAAPAVLTQGAAGLDFTDAGTGTCATNGTSYLYQTTSTCTVNVNFTPRHPGTRYGAVVLSNSSGVPIATAYIYGTGTGPQIAYSPSPAIAIDPMVNASGLYFPKSMAVDGAGDLFIADTNNSRIVEVPAGGAPTVINATANDIPLIDPVGVAVDGAGDLFIVDSSYWIVEVPAGGGSPTIIYFTVNGEQLNGPSAVAVDGAGDLFVADKDNNRVVELPAGGGTPTAIDPTVDGKALFYPIGVTVDGAGNLFIADSANNRVVDVPSGGGAPTAIDPTVNGSALSDPTGVAVDGAGDLFIADSANNRVVDVPSGGGAPIAISPTVDGEALVSPWSVTVDGAGDLFIADTDRSRVVELQRSQQPALNFLTSTPVGTTDTTDGTMTVQVQNIGNQALDITAVRYPADFSAASDPNPCTGSTSLNAGQECDVPVEFTPQKLGTLDENVKLTDNNLNGTGVQQLVPLTGDAVKDSQTITFAALASQTYGAAPFTVSATASSGLPVSFASTTTTVCTVSGSTVTLVAGGTCTVRATQDGNTDYSAAAAVTQSFAVTKESQTISFAGLPSQTYGTAPFTVSATASSGLLVNFASTTTTVCTVSGSTVTLVAGGTCSVRATQDGNADYSAAAAVTRSFAVSKESQTISFAALSSQTLGAAPFTVSASATSGLAVSFASTTSTVCTVSGSTVTLVAHGTCSIEATQAGNAYFAAATAVTRSFAVAAN